MRFHNQRNSLFKFILEFMNDLLSKEGHQVLTAEDGLSTLDILKTYTPDVIFIDLVMPNIDGRKLCKIIRGKHELKDTFLVILSGTAVEKEMSAAELKANVCIVKGPLDEMAQNILSTLDQVDPRTSKYVSEEVIGIENLYVRRATLELLSVKEHFEVILPKYCN